VDRDPGGKGGDRSRHRTVPGRAWGTYQRLQRIRVIVVLTLVAVAAIAAIVVALLGRG
jgi:hypothetical protein